MPEDLNNPRGAAGSVPPRVGPRTPRAGGGANVDTNNIPAQNPVAPQQQPAAPQQQPAAPQAPAAPQVAPQAPAQEQPAPRFPVPQRPPAADQYRDKLDQVRQTGISEEVLQSAINARDTGTLNDQEFTDYLDRLLRPQDQVDQALNEAVQDPAQAEPDAEIQTSAESRGAQAYQDQITEGGRYADEALSSVEAARREELAVAQQTQETRVQTANDRYNTEVQILDDAMALQQQLAAQQQALIASATEIQKQEARNAYEANQRAIDLQKTKVAQAYEAMQAEQELLNRQRKVREETALGLIYGGFGSVAANRNLEETIMRGEREVMRIKQEAVNKDTELQNQAIELTKAYELDVRKIEQWKAEETNKVYSALQAYVQDIKADKMMASQEKAAAINQAVTDYNTKVAEISTSVAQARYDLSLALLDRSDRLKQQEFNNKIATAQEERAEMQFQFGVREQEKATAMNDLNLLLSNYTTANYEELPDDVKARMTEIAKQLNMPEGFAEQAFGTFQQAALQGEFETKFFTDNSGNVRMIRYNPQTGAIDTMNLGAIDGAKDPNKVWTTKYNSATGKTEPFNEATGQFKTQSSYDGNLPEIFGVGTEGGWCGVYASKISTADRVGDTWAEKATHITHWDNPSQGDKLLIPLGVQTDTQDYGHVAVVLGYNPETGMIDVVESNRDGRQNRGAGPGIVTVGSYSLEEVINSGGGFVAGNLRPEYQSALGSAGGGNQNVQRYVDFAKNIDIDDVKKMIKEEVPNADERAAILREFNQSIIDQGIFENSGGLEGGGGGGLFDV